ncbi:MAG: hypothetical protein ACP5K1_01185 [Candidatus Bathyarchaeia archaeon]
MWLPRWLGMGYVKLYARFNSQPFDFEQAWEALGLDVQRVRLSLSRLRRAGYMVIFGKPVGGASTGSWTPPWPSSLWGRG